jgi:hypothetical protein
MNDAERIARLELVVRKLIGVLERRDTIKDGNWGWPSYRDELAALGASLVPKASHVFKDAKIGATLNEDGSVTPTRRA